LVLSKIFAFFGLVAAGFILRFMKFLFSNISVYHFSAQAEACGYQK